jgi:DNA-binding transcriptional regulator LsrR (DeoR family)
VLLAQKGLKDVFSLARAAELYVVGIGEVGAHAHMLATGTVTDKELREVKRAGAVGEVIGRFLDKNGQAVAAELNERAVAVKLEEIKGKSVVAVAGGADKTEAIKAVLESHVIKGLITDEATAKAIVDSLDGGDVAAGKKMAKR